MEELIVSVVSLIVLVPIIYYLPLGFTNKGKLVIVLAAFIFANLGMLARNTFPLWQIGLIILLILILTVYILDKRLSQFIFSSVAKKEVIQESLEEIRDDSQGEFVLKDEGYEIADVEGEITVDNNPFYLTEEEHEDELEEVSFDYDVVANNLSNLDSEQLVNDTEVPILMGEDESLTFTGNEGTDSTGYLSEIEQLVAFEEIDDSNDFFIEIEENSQQLDKEFSETEESYSIDELQETDTADNKFKDLEDVTIIIEEEDTEAIQDFGDIEIEEQLEEKFDDVLDESNFYSFDESYNEVAASFVNEEEDAVFQEIEQENSYQDVAEIEPFDTEMLSSDSMNNLEHAEEMETEVNITDENEMGEEDIKREQGRLIQQQLFHTMVSQLRIARKKMKPEDYEALIKEHFHPNLSIHDYYTFASLLIEHYISHKEIGKLQELLTILDGKFENYPILDMEIHYLYQQYCENTR
jgi:hypothetical protein